ncbi:hypothetical protein CTAYLR_001356 [Chrysophaeum taylorii]|uniref:Uncharacterized protein n=1 Tax=Chrysophaeum taylorii TaxID=2483200 RepID=A0AAD7U7H0_9STRA|nr:hypothetical protein CTAYLR_001356 [Chrysophaeum taylorii]
MLEALECPFAVDMSDRGSVMKLVRWIEDRKVRMWEIEDRRPLQRSDGFDEAFARYLKELGCEIEWPNADCIVYLVAKAVECDYVDDEARIVADAEAWRLQRLKVEKRALEIDAACSCLGLEGDSLFLLGAAARLRDDDDAQGEEEAPPPPSLRPEAFPLGFDAGDAECDRVARSLRILYLLDLRRLQDSINDILVQAQNVVADPKTNASLGRVGS